MLSQFSYPLLRCSHPGTLQIREVMVGFLAGGRIPVLHHLHPGLKGGGLSVASLR